MVWVLYMPHIADRKIVRGIGYRLHYTSVERVEIFSAKEERVDDVALQWSV